MGHCNEILADTHTNQIVQPFNSTYKKKGQSKKEFGFSVHVSRFDTWPLRFAL